MELKWLEDFLSLADSGSFSRSAEQRHVSQPAFSRRIRALEAWLGVVLVDRSTFPTRLTEAGEAFKGPAADLINRLHGARALVRGHQAAAGDALVFAVPHTLAFAFFPAWLGRLKTGFGELPVRLVAGNVHDVVTMLVEGGCDLLLCYHHPAQPVWLDPGRFEGLRLPLEQVRPYLPRRLVGAADWQLPGRPEEPIPFLRYGSNTYLRRMVDTILDRAVRPAHLAMQYESDMAESLKAMLLAGHGLAFLPVSAVAREVERGEVVVAGGPEWSLEMEVRLYRDRANSRPGLLRLWQYLAAQTAHPPG
ncbi:LysR family transcriptional regulator [Thauera chlorobenzoica]|uniref:Transcriptional regulator n=1 Tax=Thauera chlorobenzoica TaxID=96773 RepID=A0A1H5RWK8_9RHOO|nr:LysR substrate-binding domain-containing protein [Thauera chlorobenzoica]APR05091.1 Transcriptional regulator [Thauera chlorobenzoica]SEF42746.1 DNA-binding transcriptional regulator, LysR family [Thauera chlorobenzoica]